MENKQIWNTLRTPPKWALKNISGGRLNGMTDIKPMWRYQAMTELFGPCGIGWKYIIEDIAFTIGSDGQMICNVRIKLFIKVDGAWSDAIPGVGGSMFIAKEKAGLHTSDECVKMATTDALSVAMKMIGVAADIYAGGSHDSKYEQSPADNVKDNFQGTEVSLTIETLPDDIKADLKILKFNRGEVREICEIAKWSIDTIRTSVKGLLKDKAEFEESKEA